MRHLTLALRTLRKTPFVTTIAVLSLALGLGANAAIFSLFDQLLARKLPVRASDELVNLATPGPKPGSDTCNQSGDCSEVMSYPMFRDLERSNTGLASLAAFRYGTSSLSVRDQPFTADAGYVSGGYFATLGLVAQRGRLITPAEDDGGHFVAVLSHELWVTRFGSDQAVVGKTITLNGQSLEIIGVAPDGFIGNTVGSPVMLYVPITIRKALMRSTSNRMYEERRAYWLYAFGRRKPGQSLAQAAAGVEAAYRPIINDVEAPLQAGMSAQTLSTFRKKPILVTDGSRGQSSMHREAAAPLMLLFGVTAIVLLIACANIANLLLARGAARATEMGVRLALGASRMQLVTQLLAESLLLALAGGIASLFVAQWTLGAIGTILPANATQALVLKVEPRVMLFSGALALATGVLFGLFPALHSTRADLISSIRAGANQITAGRAASRFRHALVTVQIALSMALLISSGLFLRSLRNVSSVDLGMHVDDMVTFSVNPERAGYDSTRATAFFQQVAEAMAAIPGVTAVTETQVPLLAGENWGNSVTVQGFPHGPDVDNNSRYNAIGAGYFNIMGVRLKAGREFTTADALGGSKVVIVNEAFTEKFRLGRDAVGKFMNNSDSGPLDMQIVGVVPNVKYSSVKDSIPPVFYLPSRQQTRLGQLHFYVRTSLDGGALLGTIRTLLARMAPTVPVEDLSTMPQQIRDNVFLDRMMSMLTAAFACVATLLAGIGLYGVLAYSVAQRTREIGVRMALGADAAGVRRLVLRQVGGMLLVGGAIGIVAALGLGAAARSLLFGIQGQDPLTFGTAVILLALIAFGAGWVPARRASLVDPMLALRYD